MVVRQRRGLRELIALPLIFTLCAVGSRVIGLVVSIYIICIR